MPIFDTILKELSSHIKKRFIILDFCSIPRGVFFIENETEYEHDCIYIGAWKEICSVIKNKLAPEHTTFFVAGEKSSPLHDMAIAPIYNVVVTDLPPATLSNRLTSIIIKMQRVSKSDINPAFNNLLYEIILKDQTDVNDVREILRMLDHKILQYFNFVIIKFEDQNFFLHDRHHAFAKLSSIFTDCNISVFDHKVIILYTRKERYVKLPKNTEECLEAFLGEYNAIASIGTPFRDYHMLKTEYRICDNLLEIVSHLDDKNKSRIFHEDDFGPYFIIDLCAKKYEELFSSNDIIYLVHPGLIALSRYDSQHNTNLRDLLYCYLCNDRNLSKTAKEMFMHRNTVLNKLNKINAIIDDDLDHYAVRFRLTFSFMIIKYYEQVKNLTLHL